MDIVPYFDGAVMTEKKIETNLDQMNGTEAAASPDAVKEAESRQGEARGGGRGRRENEDNPHHDEAGDHFIMLKNTADLVNQALERKGSPYRFYIFWEGDDIYIDLVKLDATGNKVAVRRKNITYQEFNELIMSIEKGEGLFFDAVA